MAFLTTGAVAAQLQQQLLSSRSGTLMKGLQQAGVAASSIVFSSLDVQQVIDSVPLCTDNLSGTLPLIYIALMYVRRQAEHML